MTDSNKVLITDVASHLRRSNSKLGSVSALKSNPSENKNLQVTSQAKISSRQMDLEQSHMQMTTKTVNHNASHKFDEESKVPDTSKLLGPDTSKFDDVDNAFEREQTGSKLSKPDSVQHERKSNLLNRQSDMRAGLIKTAPEDANVRAGASPDAAGSLDVGSVEASKIPDSLQEKQSFVKASDMPADKNKLLNEDIPVDRKPKKGKKKKRFNNATSDLTSLMAYSPQQTRKHAATTQIGIKPQIAGKGGKMRQSYQSGPKRHFGVPHLTDQQMVQMHRTSVDAYQERRQMQDRPKPMTIDLQINNEKSVIKDGSKTDETPVDYYTQQQEDSPTQIKTVDNSTVGDGLRLNQDEDSTVNYEQNEMPHSAQLVDRGQVHYREFERPSRQRKKKFSRYEDDGYAGGSLDQYSSPQHSARGMQPSNRYNSLVIARRVKNENSRMLQSLETRFSILQQNEQRVLNRIAEQRSRAEKLMEIRDLREKEKKDIQRNSIVRNNLLQQQKLENFKAKEGQRLNLSIVQQSMMLTKKLNHLEIRRERSFHERDIRSQRSREQSAKKERSSSMKKQRLQAQHSKMMALQQADLQRKNSHVTKVINEFKTTKMQEKVINSLSNIESLMINKLANTQQKYQVLKSSDKKDVLDFLKREDNQSRSRKRSTSKFRNKVKNVHSINNDGLMHQPPMQFVSRVGALNAIGKIPNASMVMQPEYAGQRSRSRKRSSSKKKNFAYVSMLSARSAESSVSRSKSVQRSSKMRSSSVHRSPKQNHFTKLRDTNPFGPELPVDQTSSNYRPKMGHLRNSNDHSTLEKLPKTRIIRVKKKKRRVFKSTMPIGAASKTQDLQFMPQPNLIQITQQDDTADNQTIGTFTQDASTKPLSPRNQDQKQSTIPQV